MSRVRSTFPPPLGATQPTVAPNFSELRANLAEMLKDILRRQSPPVIERVAEPMEQGILAAERERAVADLNKSRDHAREIRDAIASIDAGTYGECLDCGEEISAKRLAAKPWATQCIPCRELYEEEIKRRGKGAYAEQEDQDDAA